MRPTGRGTPAHADRVLIVDDSSVVRRLVGDALRGSGYLVDEAQDGAVALGMLARSTYDVVLTDLNMPQLGGFELLETVRLSSRAPEVVILTGSHARDIDCAIRALRLGACDYLTKPLSGPEEVIVAIERAVGTKRQREALRAAEARYRELFDNVPIGLFRASPSGEILDANAAMVKMLGFPNLEALLFTKLEALCVNQEDHERWREAVELDDVVSSCELQLRRRDDSIVWAALCSRFCRDAAGKVTHAEGSLQDISERKRAEVEIREAQKMDAVGRLAGGVAHDFNNLLGVIIGSLELTSRRQALDERCARDLDRARAAADRAAGLTRQLLAFGRRQVLRPQVVDLNRILHGMRGILDSLTGESVEVKFELSDELGLVHADPSQIEQVLLNLVVNARDAMPMGGTVTVRTSNVDHDVPGPPASRAAASQVLLAVTDTGTGMDSETLARVFEPFFTTKSNGRGSGLGLATVYGIVTQSGGHVSVRSEASVGSEFRVYLPRLEGARPSPPTSPERPAAPARGTVLVVEDERDLRQMICQGLDMYGYTTIAATSGPEALALADRLGGSIDLLLTDVVMPGMSGPALARSLRATRQSLRVLFVSGYPDDAIAPHGILPEVVPFLGKPFTLETLARKVAEVLASEASPLDDAPPRSGEGERPPAAPPP